MTVGDRIRKRRIELGLSQLDLALKMGYSGKTSISKAESTGDNVTTTKVKKFADALDCDWKYLMGWVDINGNTIESENPYSTENAKLIVPIISDKKLAEALHLYFGLSDKKKHKVIDFIFLLADDE